MYHGDGRDATRAQLAAAYNNIGGPPGLIADYACGGDTFEAFDGENLVQHSNAPPTTMQSTMQQPIQTSAAAGTVADAVSALQTLAHAAFSQTQ